MQFGKTNAKTNEATRPKVKFEDVAGVDEAVEELEEIRDFERSGSLSQAGRQDPAWRVAGWPSGHR